MSWTNVCVEGFCFGGKGDNDFYPCGKRGPSVFCLGEGDTCPHFAFGETTERDVAIFVPLYKILWDRCGIWTDTIHWKFRWWFWDSLPFNRRKMDAFLKSIPVMKAEDVPSEIKEQELQADRDFPIWFSKMNKNISHVQEN